jgi:hypothetical protein
MAKTKTNASVKDEKEVDPKLAKYLEKILALQREFLNDVGEEDKSAVLDELQKANTKAAKTVKSSMANTKYQQYVDDFLETKKKLIEVFKDSEPIIIISGKSRTPITAKLTGYNTTSGDIYVEFMNDEKELEAKLIKAKSVIDDISKIPAPKAPKQTKKKK